MEGSSSQCGICLEEERVTVSLEDDLVLRQFMEELLDKSIDLVEKSFDLCLDCREKLCEFNHFKKMAMENQARFLPVSDGLIKSEPSNDLETSDIETNLYDEDICVRDGLNEEINTFDLNSQQPIKKKVGRIKGTVNRHLDNPFKCGECDLRYSSWQSLQKHSEGDHPQSRMKCTGCNITLFGKATLSYHQEMCCFFLGKAKQELVCHVCSRKFISRAILTKHLKMCGKDDAFRFDKLASWAAHTRKCSSEEKKFTCPKCNRQLQKGSGKSSHIKKCDGSRSNYSCCDTDFASFKPFLIHKRMKHGFTVDENSCKCPICPDKVLKTPILMMMHLRNLHFSRKIEETFPCPIAGCGKILQQLKSVAGHLKTHKDRVDREVFLCDLCDKHFLSEKAKDKHRFEYHQEFVGIKEEDDDTMECDELDIIADAY